ncbi:hypothetical protein IWW41_005687, partial [Coemansia sp. RSA 2522]
FLPLRRRRAVALRQMLVYAWFVCGLAMAWPSVLRTTGLISERAYILPVASLVEPLWTPYELDEPMVLEPARQPDSGVSSPPETMRGLVSDGLLTCPTQGGASAADKEPAPESRITRRQLLQTLDSDTMPRTLVRCLLHAGAHVSPHVSITLAYVVWWLDPDLIVPLSPATVDSQLGYIRAAPRAPPVVAFGVPPAFSEWYGMLRRLERHSVRLPQASDGTPLVLRPSGEPVRLDQAFTSHLESADSESIVQSAYSAAVYGATTTVSLGLQWVREALQRLADTMLAYFARASRLVGVHLSDTPAGTLLDAFVRGVGGSLSISIDVVCMVWEYVVWPLLWHVSLAMSGLVRAVMYVAELAVPAISDRVAGDHSAGGSLAAGGSGLGGAVPSVFLASFWNAAAAHDNAAVQRLRPELWSHLFGADTHFVYDVMPQPLQPSLNAIVG